MSVGSSSQEIDGSGGIAKSSALDDGSTAYAEPSSRPEAGLGDATHATTLVSSTYPPRRDSPTRDNMVRLIIRGDSRGLGTVELPLDLKMTSLDVGALGDHGLLGIRIGRGLRKGEIVQPAVTDDL